MAKHWETVRPWAPDDGWTISSNFHASHACGWTCLHPDSDPAGFRVKREQHAKSCPWPDSPPLVETVSD